MTESIPSHPHVRRLVVIGVGLIGGSLAAAARGRGLFEEVWGVAPSEHVRVRAEELGIVDRAYPSIADIATELGDGDVIFIAVPTLSTGQVLAEIAAAVSPEVTITDGASVKGSVLADVRQVYGGVPEQIVLGHPIAGSEKSGVEAANPDLYERHRVILTPLPETGAEHLARVRWLWQAVGAEVLHLDVQQHDDILAATSHLPHAIAFSLVDTLAHDSQNQDIFRYAAGGFRDFTRIASSDATMWRDIMLANQQAVVKAIDLFTANLNRLRDAVVKQDERELLGIFTRAKAARDHFTKMLQLRALVDHQGINKPIAFRVVPGRQLLGNARVPGDKSITHRAIMLGAIAEGTTEITGLLESEDALATLQAFRDMGVVIVGPSEGQVTIHGVGLGGLQRPVGPIYLGNSATSMRLLVGILAAQSFDSVLTGGALLTRRSMARVIGPLQRMGAQISSADGHLPPLHIRGGQALVGIDYQVPVASAQVKSCLLLAGLYAQGITRVSEPLSSRDHTERMLQGFGYPVERALNSVAVTPGGRLLGRRIDVPADLSSAAIFVLAATIVENSEITLSHVGVNPSRLGVLTALQAMGANIAFGNVHKVGDEPVADLQVRSAPLKAVALGQEQVAQLLDELPAVLIAAACAEGTTVLAATDLPLESNSRLRLTVAGLQQLGVDCSLHPDALRIKGGSIRAGEIDSGGDHRVAMAFAVAGLVADGPVTVNNCASVTAAFPGFVELAQQLGISLEVVNR